MCGSSPRREMTTWDVPVLTFFGPLYIGLENGARGVGCACCSKRLVVIGKQSSSVGWSVLRSAAHNITQQPPPSLFSNMSNEALVAASNTSSTPSPLRLEHSRYLRAPISLAACSPSAGETKRCDRFRISSMANGSSRKSFFRPTRMIGTSGHRSCASTTHCNHP